MMNVVNYGTEAVAQHAFALLLELCRRTALHDAGIRSGRWAAGPDWCFWDTPQVELSGKVMGILGFGTIGRRVAELAHAFGMKVIAASARKSAAELSASSAPVSFPVEFVEMDELFRASDVLSLHCPLTDQTRAIVNAANIASMKDGAILLNLARGPLLDEAAVAEALASGKLGERLLLSRSPGRARGRGVRGAHRTGQSAAGQPQYPADSAYRLGHPYRPAEHHPDHRREHRRVDGGPAQKRGEQGLSERINDRGSRRAPFFNPALPLWTRRRWPTGRHNERE